MSQEAFSLMSTCQCLSICSSLAVVCLLCSLSSGSSQSVIGFIGHDVLLPCIYPGQLPNDVNAFWRDRNDRVVLDIINGRENKMDPKFKGRVFSDPDQYKKGNLSILIQDLRADDAGSYDCLIPSVDYDSRLTLRLTEKPAVKVMLETPPPAARDAAVTSSLHLALLSAPLFVLFCSLNFVSAVLGHYYKTDDEVQHDDELQTWIHDVYEHGFLSRESTGIPQKFTTVDEMVKFVTMVIFTGSAQHSAINMGQYDFGGWMPNYPTSLELPPPTKKGDASETRILNTLPDVSTTVHGMGTVWLLSRPSADSVFLGHYPNEHFTEEFPLQKIQEFQVALKNLSADINDRNKKLSLPYTYLDPGVIENSVSI